jgi:uncharacterized protein YecT (DUF1311 family)
MLRHAVPLLLYVCACMSAPAHACDEMDLSDEIEVSLQGAYERAWSGADEDRRELLARSQIAWRDYRGANCEVYASRGAWLSQDAYAQCLKYMTEERTQDLRLICLTSGQGQGCQP